MLREEHRLIKLENMVLRSILGPKGEEVTRGELTICTLHQTLLRGWIRLTGK
jgi:hypothetical protein